MNRINISLILTAIGFLAFSFSTFSQVGVKEDSIMKSIQTQKDDTNKIKKLRAFASETEIANANYHERRLNKQSS